MILAFHPESWLAEAAEICRRAGEGGAFDEPTRAFHAALSARAHRPGDEEMFELKKAWRAGLWKIAADLATAKTVVDYAVNRGLLPLWKAR